MVQKLRIWVFVTALLIIGSNGFGSFDSSEEEDSIEWDQWDLRSDVNSDNDSGIDESDYWDLLSELGKFDDNADVNREDEDWKQIDNMILLDDGVDESAEMIQLKQMSEVHGSARYYLGKRVRGDKIVAVSAKNQTWPRVQDIKTNMTYPSVGVHGKNLTFIEIRVNQTSNLGQAYIVRGGIGKRFITVIVEAYHTLYFNYKAAFYGK